MNELGAFSYKRLPSGLFSYSAPSGFHDDCVTALALGVWGVEKAYGARVVGTMAPFFEQDEQTEQSERHVAGPTNRFIDSLVDPPWDDDEDRITSYMDD